MKKLFGMMIVVYGFLSFKCYSQIVYEHTYPYVNGPTGDLLQLKDIGNGDFKYIYTDYLSNELKIFNIDHSPFLIIPVSTPLLNKQEYVIGYVTKSLFDCDTNMIEYALMPVNWRKTLYINRQDGTVLFSRDSTVATYCFGCFSGSYDVRPIVNTPSGTKMFLAKNDTNGFQMTVDVYSLCGTLPAQTDEDLIVNNSESMTVYPIPSHRSQIYFQLDKSLENANGQLTIFDSSGKIIKGINIDENNKQFIFDGSLYLSGMYYYKLISKNKIIQSGKFIIN